MVRLLVTGGLGFIGSNFIRYMLSEHADTEIVNVDKIGLGANPGNLENMKGVERYQLTKGDISDRQLVNDLIKRIDVVINFAAETHVDRSIADPAPFLESNILGAFMLLEAIRKLNETVKYVQISTDEIYGDVLEGSFSEIDKLNPSNPYSATKASADMLCMAYHKTYGLDMNITRCTNNFGPYQFPEKLIPKTIVRALKSLPIPIYGTGRNVRDWIYVLDHCEAISLVLSEGKPGEIYNVSSGDEFQNIEIVKEILRVIDKSEDLITFVEDRPGHDLRYSLDSSKIRSDLGWKPRHTFPSALEGTVEWYVNNESWWRPLATEKVLHATPWKIE